MAERFNMEEVTLLVALVGGNAEMLLMDGDTSPKARALILRAMELVEVGMNPDSSYTVRIPAGAFTVTR